MTKDMMTILCTRSLPDRVFPQITISFCSAWWESPALDCVVMVNNLKWVRRQEPSMEALIVRKKDADGKYVKTILFFLLKLKENMCKWSMIANNVTF